MWQKKQKKLSLKIKLRNRDKKVKSKNETWKKIRQQFSISGKKFDQPLQRFRDLIFFIRELHMGHPIFFSAKSINTYRLKPFWTTGGQMSVFLSAGGQASIS